MAALNRPPPQSSANLQTPQVPPPSRRIALPVSERLNSITEDSNNARRALNPRPAVPHRGILLNGSSNNQSRWSASTVNTAAPPAYEWVPEPIPGEDEDNGPVEGEKLAELRRKGPYYKPQRKGGLGRILLVLGIIALLAIALGVGLGVGLKKHKHDDGNQSGSGSDQNSTTTKNQPFPLGEYSMITALRTTTTNCTSNPATWRCYPYTTYDENSNASLATFNWLIANTSSIYASNATTISTPDHGIPANLTISSTSNPFSISFVNETLTYISTSSNSTSPRYIFSFSEHKSVFPASSLTSDNTASECFFNQTTFTGTLYLKAPTKLPGTSSASDSNYTSWPYAIEIMETSPGGHGSPTCYQYINGNVGAEITPGPQAQADNTMCSCEYRNY